MPYFVNGQAVPEDLILQESERVSRDLRWRRIKDEQERARQVRAAAEHSAINRILVEQAAAADPRPVDSAAVEGAVQGLKGKWNCRSGFDDTELRRAVERSLRFQRTAGEMMAGVATPTAEEVEQFYIANRENFRMPEAFRAAHIVKHVNGEQTKELARAGIGAALAALERGEAFSAVADLYSDCKGNGGDLGQFGSGHMVPEFEDAVRTLEPGERTGVFRTPFGLPYCGTARKIRAPARPAFEEVSADIKRVLAAKSQHEAYLRL